MSLPLIFFIVLFAFCHLIQELELSDFPMQKILSSKVAPEIFVSVAGIAATGVICKQYNVAVGVLRAKLLQHIFSGVLPILSLCYFNHPHLLSMFDTGMGWLL